MKLHSFGTAVACSKCGQPSKKLYADTPQAAASCGLCPACYAQVQQPVSAEPARAGRRARRSLAGLVEAERERELMRGELTGVAGVPAESEVEVTEGDGSEGGPF